MLLKKTGFSLIYTYLISSVQIFKGNWTSTSKTQVLL